MKMVEEASRLIEKAMEDCEAKKVSQHHHRSKFDRKYMRLAKTLAEDNDACHSRKIGVLLIGANGRPISFGYNGSVEGNPHTDSPEYLEHLYNDLLTAFEKEHLEKLANIECAEQFVGKYAGCKNCPRRLFGYASGVRLDLCNCAHAERNSLANAGINGVSTEGSTMYCWCGVPCHDCTMQIINSHVKRVVCLHTSTPDYSPSSRWMLKQAGIELDIIDEKWVMSND